MALVRIRLARRVRTRTRSSLTAARIMCSASTLAPSRSKPIGVVGIITPWNFPLAIPAWKIAPALAYGNTVVIKPADLVPASTWALVDILHRAGLPKGVLNLVIGRGSEVGAALLEHPDVAEAAVVGTPATASPSS